MIQYTDPEHRDIENLQSAYKQTLSVAQNIENLSADAISVAKVMEFASSFIHNNEPFKIVVPHRRYIIEENSISWLPDRPPQDVC